MGRKAAAIVVLLALLTGIVLGSIPKVEEKVYSAISMADSMLGLGLTRILGHKEATETVAKTATVTEAKTITLTKYSTSTTTLYKTKTLYVTTTIRETETKTIEKTRTVTKTVTSYQGATTEAGAKNIQPGTGTSISQETMKALQELVQGPPVPRPSNLVYEASGVKIYQDHGLLVERPSYPGYYVATIYAMRGHETVYLIPCCLETRDMLPPSLVYANKTIFLEYYSAETLAAFLGEGAHIADIPLDKSHAIECKILVNNKDIEIEKCKKILVNVEGPELNGYPSLLDAVLGSYNEETLAKLRRTIYGDKAPRSPAATAWETLEWVEKHISYDYEKERERSPAVYSPLKLLELGKGVCSDYAVLLAAALLASGQKTAYIVAMSLEPVPHAVAATSLNNTLFVLDQHPPPIEVGDYAEYLLGNKTIQAYVIKATWTSSGLTVKAYPAELGPELDTYPLDKIPEKTIEEARLLISRETGTKPAKELETVIETGNVYTYIDRYLEPLAGITGQPVPIGVLYSPALDKEWAKTIAMTGEQILRQYYPEALGRGSFWLTLSQTREETRVKLYATPFPEPRITIAQEGNNLVITVETRQRVTETSIQLIIYNSDKTICAAIAPPGYTYPGTTTITATKWTTRQNTVTITLDKNRLIEATSQCTSPVLDIWMNKAIIYSLRIKP